MADEFARRDLIKLTAGAVLSSAAQGADGFSFFTREEYSMVEELTEMIIPADEKSGGAKAAKVADYIAARLAEAFEPEDRDKWRSGLKAINSICRKTHDAGFLDCADAQREAVLSAMAANEKNPKSPEEEFFRDLKEWTVKGYYTSRIGIHDDMDYKGNTYQSRDYSGALPHS
jgi:gluconate 2-dehydrogenase gamma chain